MNSGEERDYAVQDMTAAINKSVAAYLLGEAGGPELLELYSEGLQYSDDPEPLLLLSGAVAVGLGFAALEDSGKAWNRVRNSLDRKVSQVRL